MTGVGLDRNGGVMLVLPKGQRVTFSASEAESIWKGRRANELQFVHHLLRSRPGRPHEWDASKLAVLLRGRAVSLGH